MENLSSTLLSLGISLLRLKTCFYHTSVFYLIKLAAPKPSSTTTPSSQQREYKPRSTRCQSISSTTTRKRLSSCWVKESSNLQPLHTALRLSWSINPTVRIRWPLVAGYSTQLRRRHTSTFSVNFVKIDTYWSKRRHTQTAVISTISGARHHTHTCLFVYTVFVLGKQIWLKHPGKH